MPTILERTCVLSSPTPQAPTLRVVLEEGFHHSGHPWQAGPWGKGYGPANPMGLQYQKAGLDR